MKKISLAVFFLCIVLPVFSQRVSSIVIYPFEVIGRGVSNIDAAAITKQVVSEISSWGTIAVLEEKEAGTADYVVRGQLTLDNRLIALTATTYEVRENKPLTSYRVQAENVRSLSSRLFTFCIQMMEPIPLPNYLLGKWISTVALDDGLLTCILVFNEDRTVTVERYDTYEHRQGNSLMYQGYGSGTYAYNVQIRKMETIRDVSGASRETPVDGSVTLSLSLEDALPNYRSLRTERIKLAFTANNTSFELLTAGFPCGDDFDSPSAFIAYTRFTKIQ
jgi:hypothetical protein